MAAPTIDLAAFDQPSYPLGAQARLTITYSDADTRVLTGTITVRDPQGQTGTTAFSLPVVDVETLTVTDSGNHVWTKVSDDGHTAVFVTTV